jgi:L-serine dehydratase
MEHCRKEKKAIWEIILENEKSHRSEKELKLGIMRIWDAMCSSVERGIRTEGVLPGGLNVQRRAPALYKSLQGKKIEEDPTLVMEWVSLYALAVNEENAAGSRVVTAPTNGSAGVIPAVLHYARQFMPGFGDEDIYKFFLTTTALLILYKENASISAAEMGCQGEIGVSSSMAAAGLAAILGGTNEQIENAAEIAMEHHLGMTCDPIGGLVQIPCIERNTMGAIKAINSARLALRGDGSHRVSLDAVIRAMKETGKNMKTMYKETSEGGLAVQITLAATAC